LLALSYRGDEGQEEVVSGNNHPDDLLYRHPEKEGNAIEDLKKKEADLKVIKQSIAAAKPAPRSIKRKPEKVASPADDPWQFSSTAAMADLETARYLERAEVLLRSFRNVSETGESIDVALEKEQSRDLLYKNILLRRTAEAKGNLPVSDLLGSLEPILIDIANLPESPTRQEVQLIKDFIRQKEMVATIQVYSSPAISVDAR
jgi:hypothetical protein